MSATRKRPRSESPHDGNDAQCSTPVHGSGETVSDPAYHHNRSKALSSLWENRELTDVVVVVEGQRFPAHRVVLAAGSQHFRAMFTRSFAESRADEVELHEIAAEGFQTVLSFLYAGEVALRDGTVESVLLAADRCEVLGLMSLCCDYLLERISRHNCLHFWSLAEQVNCESLRRQSRLCALKKFEELHQTNRLLELDSSRLGQIIKSKKLRAANEEVVLDALLEWVKHDLPNRRQYADNLLRLVRLPRLPEDRLRALSHESPFLEGEGYSEGPEKLSALMEEVARYKAQTLDEQRPTQQLWAKKRWCEVGWLYAVGGSDGQHHLDSVERYEAVENAWYPVAPMRTARRNCGVGVLNGQLYAVGGRNESKQVMDNIERYDSHLDRWERVEHSMRTARYFLAVGVLKSKLYIVGGVDKRNSSLNSAECYDSEAGRWTPVANMSQPRYGCGAGVLNGKLYVVGGTQEKNGDYLKTVERYDSETDEWETVAPMSMTRYCCGVAVMNGRLYAVGGVDIKYNKLASVESFDPESGEWSEEPPMLTARYNCGVGEEAGKLYVVGGRDDKNRALMSVECFDAVTKQWGKVKDMSTVRSSGAVAVLPPYVKHLDLLDDKVD
mmetsp:Transcript_22011/g.52846  ORF Transcript_22011/g.52846 Transcript_22011/m.52846 type:complete len:613 (+) Transcript_22011:35-1873(+)